ncbi:ABC transporter permease [Myxococcus sp. 1LA]
MSPLLQDVRLSLRRMRREVTFTLVIVGTLALAIGATTAVFSAVYQVLLRPLPYRAPEQLVTLFQSTPQRERLGVSLRSLHAWRERSHVFQGLDGLVLRDVTLAGDGEAERVRVGRATAGLLPLLGVQPLVGHAFGADTEVAGHDAVLLLSHALWQRRFGGRPDVVGQRMLIDDRLHTVVGVLPASFRFAPDVEAWKPLALAAEESPGGIWLRVVGRLRQGVAVEQARAEMTALGAALTREPGFAEEPAGVRLVPLQAQVVEGAQERLWLLAGVVALVLLVACANVANLLLARASAREREVSVRSALGAGRGRLVRQFLVESGMLALAGGAAGLVLAMWGMDLLRVLLPPRVVSPEALRLEPHVLAIALGLSLLTSLLFGLVPALRVSSRDGTRRAGRAAWRRGGHRSRGPARCAGGGAGRAGVDSAGGGRADAADPARPERGAAGLHARGRHCGGLVAALDEVPGRGGSAQPVLRFVGAGARPAGSDVRGHVQHGASVGPQWPGAGAAAG